MEETMTERVVILNPTTGEAYTAVPMEMDRKVPAAPLELIYTDDDVPDAFVDVRDFSAFEVTIPAALNGRTITPLSADDTAGTGAVTPKYLNSAGAYAAMPGISVSTGDKIVFQADLFPIWYLGFLVDQAVTVTSAAPVKIRPKS